MFAWCAHFVFKHWTYTLYFVYEHSLQHVKTINIQVNCATRTISRFENWKIMMMYTTIIQFLIKFSWEKKKKRFESKLWPLSRLPHSVPISSFNYYPTNCWQNMDIFVHKPSQCHLAPLAFIFHNREIKIK